MFWQCKCRALREQMLWRELQWQAAGRGHVQGSCDTWCGELQRERWHAESLQGEARQCPKHDGSQLGKPGGWVREWAGRKTVGIQGSWQLVIPPFTLQVEQEGDPWRTRKWGWGNQGKALVTRLQWQEDMVRPSQSPMSKDKGRAWPMGVGLI